MRQGAAGDTFFIIKKGRVSKIILNNYLNKIDINNMMLYFFLTIFAADGIISNYKYIFVFFKRNILKFLFSYSNIFFSG